MVNIKVIISVVAIVIFLFAGGSKLIQPALSAGRGAIDEARGKLSKRSVETTAKSAGVVKEVG